MNTVYKGDIPQAYECPSCDYVIVLASQKYAPPAGFTPWG